MKKAEMDRLVEMTAQRTASIPLDQLKGIVHAAGEEEEEYVDVKEAARILGLAPSYLRSQRAKFPHKKVGSSTQGRILFLKSGLFQHYVNQ